MGFVEIHIGITSTFVNLARTGAFHLLIQVKLTHHDQHSDVRDENDRHRNDIDEDQYRQIVADHVERAIFPFDGTRCARALEFNGRFDQRALDSVHRSYFEIKRRPADDWENRPEERETIGAGDRGVRLLQADRRRREGFRHHDIPARQTEREWSKQEGHSTFSRSPIDRDETQHVHVRAAGEIGDHRLEDAAEPAENPSTSARDRFYQGERAGVPTCS